jgi:hypothetical protein
LGSGNDRTKEHLKRTFLSGKIKVKKGRCSKRNIERPADKGKRDRNPMT